MSDPKYVEFRIPSMFDNTSGPFAEQVEVPLVCGDYWCGIELIEAHAYRPSDGKADAKE